MKFTLEEVRQALTSDFELGSGEVALPLWSSDGIGGIGKDSSGRMALVLRPCSFGEDVVGNRFKFLTETSLRVRDQGVLRSISVLFVDCEADFEVDVDAIATVFLGLLEISTDASVKLSDVIRGLADLFETGRIRDLSIQEKIGLTGELLVILGSPNKDYAVRCWRSGERDRFDFSSHGQRIEVKTTTSTERVHSFNSAQIPGPTDCIVLVASVQLNVVEVGHTLNDLVELIRAQLLTSAAQSELSAKAGIVIGLNKQGLQNFKFDLDSSLASIRFTSSTRVPRPMQSPGVIRMSWEALVSEFEVSNADGPLFTAVLHLQT